MVMPKVQLLALKGGMGGSFLVTKEKSRSTASQAGEDLREKACEDRQLLVGTQVRQSSASRKSGHLEGDQRNSEGSFRNASECGIHGP